MRTNRNAHPLKKIVGLVNVPPEQGMLARQKVTLECGHEVWCSTATTYRARCLYCRKRAFLDREVANGKT